MTKNKMRIILCVLFLFVLSGVNGQTDTIVGAEKGKYHFISAKYNIGRVLQTNDFLMGTNKSEKPIDEFHAWSLRYGVQTDGSKDWHHIFNFPYYGVGVYTADFFDGDELGYPNAFYCFLGLPFKRTNNWLFGYELGFGLTYNWKPYSEEHNPFNIAIGSHRTVYVDANIFYKYNLSEHWDIKGGLGFSHFSNGSMKAPNKGMNLVSPFVELSYKFNDHPRLIRKTISFV